MNMNEKDDDINMDENEEDFLKETDVCAMNENDKDFLKEH